MKLTIVVRQSLALFTKNVYHITIILLILVFYYTMITEQLLANAFSYKNYISLLQNLLQQGKTTGPNQSAEFINYAKINLQRMKRLEKTASLSEEIIQRASQIHSSYIWLVITEGWCGDAAQNLPVIQAIAQLCPGIDLKLILRDEHPEIIDLYLTKGSRSIPKLICLDKKTLNEIFVWGPRPKELQDIVTDLLAKGGTSQEKGLLVQQWYNADKTKSLQEEFLILMQKLA